MVPVHHFSYELRRQLNAAAAQGSNQLLITSRDLCRAVRPGTGWLDACCEAMESKVRDGDRVVQDRSGHGMTVQ